MIVVDAQGDIDVSGETRLAMQDHGLTADHDIRHALLLETLRARREEIGETVLSRTAGGAHVAS